MKKVTNFEAPLAGEVSNKTKKKAKRNYYKWPNISEWLKGCRDDWLFKWQALQIKQSDWGFNMIAFGIYDFVFSKEFDRCFNNAVVYGLLIQLNFWFIW